MPRASRLCSSLAVPHSVEISAPEGPPDVVVVLGCRVVSGGPGAALERRLKTAAEMHRTLPGLPVIMSGGKSWDGFQESQVMAAWWRAEGRETAALFAENDSHSTRENALRVAELCARLGYRHVALVTCDFHMKRARWLFARQRLQVTAIPADSGLRPLGRLRLHLREWGAAVLGEIDSWIH